MGTEVLRPQDCLIQRIRQPPLSINHCNHYHNKNHRSARKPAKKPERSDKKRSLVVPSQPIPIPIPRRSSSDDMRIARSSGIMKEKITILRRGESLDSKIMSQALLAKKKEDDDLMSIYAGSAFAVSPSPSALPIPSFSRKLPSSSVAVDDSATRDLRRLLRLE